MKSGFIITTHISASARHTTHIKIGRNKMLENRETFTTSKLKYRHNQENTNKFSNIIILQYL
ncbi:hypothetical protein A3I58_04145 [Candidatus Peregrinibacteria bacterium RIFCSPLOWO2_02_FULL_39_10]|nr:MAG: hypothetical protein A3I58_04145 [Candidatus Peregrinibacteria bacterium RIFCSPLOWO2_02_FULL_39_10]